MAIQLSYTDPDTQFTYPQAYLRIDNIALTHLNTGGGSLIIGIYGTQAAANANATPIKKINYVLNDQQAATLRAGGLALLYGIVAADPAYSGAQQV